jgi:hypothetical protein
VHRRAVRPDPRRRQTGARDVVIHFVNDCAGLLRPVGTCRRSSPTSASASNRRRRTRRACAHGQHPRRGCALRHDGRCSIAWGPMTGCTDWTMRTT